MQVLILSLAIIIAAAAVLAQLWTETKFLKGSKMTCQWIPAKPCKIRRELHLITMTLIRLVTLANFSSLAYLAYRFEIHVEVTDLFCFIPRLLLVGIVVYMGWFYQKWGSDENGK